MKQSKSIRSQSQHSASGVNESRFELRDRRSIDTITPLVPTLKLGKIDGEYMSKSKEKLRILMSDRQESKHHKFTKLDELNDSEMGTLRARSLRRVQKIDQSFDAIQDEEAQRQLTGDQAIEQYHDTFKRIERITERNALMEFQESAQTSMIHSSQKLQLLPCRVGLIKPSGRETLNAQQYGDRYMKMLSSGLDRQNPVKRMNLHRNRMTSVGAFHMLKHAQQVELLDVSRNRIGQASCERLRSVIDSKECALRELNLAGNLLGDSLNGFFESLQDNRTLSKLTLNENTLGDKSAISIAWLLQQNGYIEELSLRWNLITYYGGQAIFNALCVNDTLRVLDLSYNQLGGSRKDNCMVAMGKFLTSNITLLHLDLSVNNFNLDECKSIKEVANIASVQSLRRNHTIYGIHFAGNYGYIDAKGFLQIREGKLVQEVHLDQPIKGVEMRSQSIFRNRYDQNNQEYRDICWICEGWQQHKFTFDIETQSGSEQLPSIAEPTFLHCDFNQFHHEYIGKGELCVKEKRNYYSHDTIRMVPPGETNYFYSCKHQQVWDTNQHSLPQMPKNQQVWFSEKQQMPNALRSKYELSCLQKIRIEFSKPVVDSGWRITCSVLPRARGLRFKSDLKPIKKKWAFPISIWARDYRFEDEDMLRRCFERDWSYVKIPKFIKNPTHLGNVQEQLWQYYRRLKNTYKQISSYYPQGDVWCISWNALTEFIMNVGLVDNRTLKLSDVDLKFIATYSASVELKTNPRNPDRSLIRYQFLEFLVRLAEDKYLKTGLARDIVEATRMILNQCDPMLTEFDAHRWRTNSYFTEECDFACKYYRPIVDSLYRAYSKKKVKPGQRRFMSLDELSEICTKSGLFDENFVDRDVNLAFNLSMLTQVDELESDRLSQMAWIEFLEALARIAEKKSLVDGVCTLQHIQTLSYEERQKVPLHLKLEALLMRFYDLIGDDELKQNFQKPQKSIFRDRGDQLEEDSQSEFEY